ncbi:MAG: hypothetical protein WDZ94_04045 [Patescibacteria group bacterium]
MTYIQHTFLYFILLLNLFIFLIAWQQVKTKRTAFGLTRWLFPLGSFVWGDALVFSVFWVLASLSSLLLSDWLLFWLIFSVFWVVRSLGETQYWFNQQFAEKKLDAPESLLGYSIFQNHSIYFAYQIFWQCLAVAAIVGSVYVAWLWLGQM